MRLGLLVPCHNEREVIERRLANLAWLAWPAGGGHRVVVVDDGSRDGTAERAADALRRIGEVPGVSFAVVTNQREPGKAGAIREGLAALGTDCDLVVLSDADVVYAGDCLLHLARAFEELPALGLACGAQRFVRDLASDGTPRGADGGEPVPAGDLYDALTARVRRLESRRGLLFSVHGQCLAWRAELGLAPTPGIAADDLELRFRTRALGREVRLVPDARFLEVKTPVGERRRDQALRRARAYFQVVWHGPRVSEPGALERCQWLFYRHVPGLFPVLLLAALAAATAAGYALLGAPGGGAVLAAAALAGATPRGREVLSLAAVIRRARRLEARAPMSDRWEMQRS